MAKNGQQLATRQERKNELRKMLSAAQQEIAHALPKHLTPERMIRLAMTCVQKNPELLDCTPISVIAGVVMSSQLGLELDDGRGHAYLVPFWNNKAGQKEAQFIPGYKGLVDLAIRSGKVRFVRPRIVREGDLFEFEYGLNERLKHIPRPSTATAPLVAVYAVARTTEGDPEFEVMWREEVEPIKQAALAKKKNKDASPWVTNYEAMCLKTVVRRICKFLPTSVELERAVHLDELHSAGVSQDLTAALGLAEPQEPPSSLDALAARLGDEPEHESEPDTHDEPAEVDPVEAALNSIRDAAGIRDVQAIVDAYCGPEATLPTTTEQRAVIQDAAEERCSEIRATRGGKEKQETLLSSEGNYS